MKNEDSNLFLRYWTYLSPAKNSRIWHLTCHELWPTRLRLLHSWSWHHASTIASGSVSIQDGNSWKCISENKPSIFKMTSDVSDGMKPFLRDLIYLHHAFLVGVLKGTPREDQGCHSYWLYGVLLLRSDWRIQNCTVTSFCTRNKRISQSAFWIRLGILYPYPTSVLAGLDSKHRDPDYWVMGYADPYAQWGEKGRKKGGFHTPCVKKFKTPESSHPFSLDVPHFWPILKHYKTKTITIPT